MTNSTRSRRRVQPCSAPAANAPRERPLRIPQKSPAHSKAATVYLWPCKDSYVKMRGLPLHRCWQRSSLHACDRSLQHYDAHSTITLLTPGLRLNAPLASTLRHQLRCLIFWLAVSNGRCEHTAHAEPTFAHCRKSRHVAAANFPTHIKNHNRQCRLS